MGLPTISINGNLKRIETKYTPSGKSITSFQVECSEKNSKGEWENLYIKGEVWEKSSEFVSKYFKEGAAANVTGKLFTNVYAKADGSKVYENKFLFPKVDFPAKDKSESPSQSAPQYQQPTNTTDSGYKNYQAPTNQVSHEMPQIDGNEDEIPF